MIKNQPEDFNIFRYCHNNPNVRRFLPPRALPRGRCVAPGPVLSNPRNKTNPSVTDITTVAAEQLIVSYIHRNHTPVGVFVLRCRRVVTAACYPRVPLHCVVVRSFFPTATNMANIELETEDKLEYRFVPTGNGVVNFKVRAPNDAHIALTTNPEESDPMLEVFIGGWKNTKSVIRKNRTKPDVAEVETPDILNAGEFRGFWIRWQDNVVTVGNEGSAAAFLSYENPEPFPINCVGFCTGWGATGSWLIEPASEQASPSAPTAAALSAGGAACWVAAANGEIPPNAVVGGSDGEDMYIGRAQHEGGIIPGKVVASHGVCYIAWGGAENPKAEYEVLCDFGGEFVPASGSDIPPTALPAGESEDGEPLFIGRVTHEGTVTVGKVQPSHGVCYIPYGGQELAFAEYEIFVSP